LTPRPRSKTAGKSDWFTTHGKYIAIAFVIALLGTIVLARLNRRAVPTLAEPKHSHPGEAGHKLTATKPPSQATIVGQVSQDQAHAKTASGIQETSPAQLAEPQPHTDLHPPTIPQLAVRPNTESTPEQPKDESLFPWAKTDERVATRPEPPTIAPAQEAPITPVPPSGAPSPANPEIAVPQYPVTATPEPVYPTAGPAAPPAPGAAYSAPGPAYPTTSTPNQYQFPAPAPAPTTQPASGPALAPPTGGSQYFPQDNSASGSRYERTGSGLY